MTNQRSKERKILVPVLTIPNLKTKHLVFVPTPKDGPKHPVSVSITEFRTEFHGSVPTPKMRTEGQVSVLPNRNLTQ